MNDAGFLRVLSAVLAGAALILFIVTIVLVVKYKIISAVRLEIASKKNVRTDDTVTDDENISGTISACEPPSDNSFDGGRLIINSHSPDINEYTGTIPASAAQLSEDEYTGTIPADTGDRISEEISGTIPASIFADDSINTQKKIPETDPDEFIIQTEIIVVHADTTPINH